MKPLKITNADQKRVDKMRKALIVKVTPKIDVQFTDKNFN